MSNKKERQQIFGDIKRVDLRPSRLVAVIKVFVLALFIPIGLALSWYASSRGLEKTPPTITVAPELKTISRAPQKIVVSATDLGSGLANIEIRLRSSTESHLLFTQKLARLADFSTTVEIDYNQLKIKDGPAVFEVSVDDDSLWKNRAIVSQSVIIDGVAPQVRILSASSKIISGGTGLVLFASKDFNSVKCSVVSGDRSFKAFPAGLLDLQMGGADLYAAFFSANSGETPYISVVDQARNESRLNIQSQITRVSAGERYNLGDVSGPVLENVRALYEREAIVSLEEEKNAKKVFLGQLSRNEAAALKKAVALLMDDSREQSMQSTEKSLFDEADSPRRFESTPRIPLLNLAAQFNSVLFLGGGPEKPALWSGKNFGVVYEQNGVNDGITAPFTGTVRYAGDLGVFGNTVLLSHGARVATMYSHLALASVDAGLSVGPGDLLGRIGSSGLVGHPLLTAMVFVNGYPVDPSEWLDPQIFTTVVSQPLNKAIEAAREYRAGKK